MPKTDNQKLKILYLMKLLLEKTDENNTLTVPEMIGYLEGIGIAAERKSIYTDIEALKQFGIDIEMRKSKTFDYYVANRRFELPELKLLVDAVSASRFITHKKSMKLIKKMESLCSIYQARELRRELYVRNRVKTSNEEIYYNVDKLHSAINNNRKVSFRYFSWTVIKEKAFRRQGKNYIADPVALSWDDDNYYLITYSEKYGSYVHYRVDKMTDVKMLSQQRSEACSGGFDPGEYTKRMFGMFTGEEEEIRLRFSLELAGVVIDRFGRDVPIESYDDTHFIVTIKAAVSPVFLSWLISFGDKVKVLSPCGVIEALKGLCKRSISSCD